MNSEQENGPTPTPRGSGLRAGGPTPAQRCGTVVAAKYPRLRLRQLEVLFVGVGQQDAKREVTKIFALLHRCQLVHRPELAVVLPVVDDALGGRRPDLGQLVKLLHAGLVYVHPQRALRLVLDLFQRSRIDHPGHPLRETRRVERTTHQHHHDKHRHDRPRSVASKGTGWQPAPPPGTTRSRLEKFVSHTTGYRDTGRNAIELISASADQPVRSLFAEILTC